MGNHRPAILDHVEKEFMKSLIRLAIEDVDLVHEMRDFVRRIPWPMINEMDETVSSWFRPAVPALVGGDGLAPGVAFAGQQGGGDINQIEGGSNSLDETMDGVGGGGNASKASDRTPGDKDDDAMAEEEEDVPMGDGEVRDHAQRASKDTPGDEEDFRMGDGERARHAGKASNDTPGDDDDVPMGDDVREGHDPKASDKTPGEEDDDPMGDDEGGHAPKRLKDRPRDRGGNTADDDEDEGHAQKVSDKTPGDEEDDPTGKDVRAHVPIASNDTPEDDEMDDDDRGGLNASEERRGDKDHAQVSKASEKKRVPRDDAQAIKVSKKKRGPKDDALVVSKTSEKRGGVKGNSSVPQRSEQTRRVLDDEEPHEDEDDRLVSKASGVRVVCEGGSRDSRLRPLTQPTSTLGKRKDKLLSPSRPLKKSKKKQVAGDSRGHPIDVDNLFVSESPSLPHNANYLNIKYRKSKASPLL